MPMGTGRRVLGGLAAVCLLCACATKYEVPEDFDQQVTAAEQSTPLGGEALFQMKQRMERSHRDMIHFHQTMKSLHHRKDRNGLVLFTGFLDAYMGLHLDPLLASQWQSKHPEVMALDANPGPSSARVVSKPAALRR